MPYYGQCSKFIFIVPLHSDPKTSSMYTSQPLYNLELVLAFTLILNYGSLGHIGYDYTPKISILSFKMTFKPLAQFFFSFFILPFIHKYVLGYTNMYFSLCLSRDHPLKGISLLCHIYGHATFGTWACYLCIIHYLYSL